MEGNKKTIFWDFDGVILDSMKVRDEGFYAIFESYPLEQVEKLMDFHNENGGLSRYVKIRFFFNEVLGQDISDEEVLRYAQSFSDIMLKKLTDDSLLIHDSLDFIKENYQNYHFHIVSGSDGKELNMLCEKLNIAHYFKTIQGSPTPKIQLVADVLQNQGYGLDQCTLIGDSKNDYDAAIENSISFYGYNNLKLTSLGNYIDTFKNFNY